MKKITQEEALEQFKVAHGISDSAQWEYHCNWGHILFDDHEIQGWWLGYCTCLSTLGLLHDLPNVKIEKKPMDNSVLEFPASIGESMT